MTNLPLLYAPLFQLVNEEIPVTEFDTIVDLIVTPTREIKVKKKYQKPKGVVREKL